MLFDPACNKLDWFCKAAAALLTGGAIELVWILPFCLVLLPWFCEPIILIPLAPVPYLIFWADVVAFAANWAELLAAYWLCTDSLVKRFTTTLFEELLPPLNCIYWSYGRPKLWPYLFEITAELKRVPPVEMFEFVAATRLLMLLLWWYADLWLFYKALRLPCFAWMLVDPEAPPPEVVFKLFVVFFLSRTESAAEAPGPDGDPKTSCCCGIERVRAPCVLGARGVGPTAKLS